VNGNVGLYLRLDKVYVIPQGGGGGLYYDMEPIVVVPSSATAELDRAIRTALDASAKTAGQPLPDLRTRKSPVLSVAGVKTIKDFYADSAHAFLYTDAGRLHLLPFRPAPDGRGFEPAGDAIAIDVTQPLASQILAALQDLPRAPAAGAASPRRR
jgi:hypothetical protein